MRMRPLGWELITLLLVIALVVVGRVAGAPILIATSLWICAVAAPIVVLSFVTRLVAAVIDECRADPVRPRRTGLFGAR